MIRSALIRRHLPFMIGGAAGIVASLAFYKYPLSPVIGANVAFAVYLGLSWRKLPHLTGPFLRDHAAAEDEPAWLIFLITLGAVGTAVASLFSVMNAAGPTQIVDLGLSLSSVALGWLTVHTMAAFHYAHRYWRPRDKPVEGKPAHRAGLDFPQTDEPGGYDFMYFAFVIGMTAQTADTDIETTAMRLRVMIHGVISFFFNTVLVAATINLAVSLKN